MMSKSKVPQIRFKGFSEEWDSKELTNYLQKSEMDCMVLQNM